MTQTPASPPPVQPPYPPQAQGQAQPSNTISILAVVFGAAALLFGLIPVAGIFLGGMFGLAAITLGIIGIFKSHRLMAIIGIALAVIGLIIATVISLAVGRAVEDVVEDWPTDVEDLTDEGADGRDDADDDEGSDSADGTDPNSPLPSGSAVDIGDWNVSFSNVVPDSTDTILAENEFNEPPDDGHQFFMFQVDAIYEGSDSGFAWDDIELGIYFNNTLYTDECGVIPNDLFETPEVYEGGTASGNACVEVPSDGVDAAVISVEDYWETSARYFVEPD
ncbi:hypothetical protein [Glycomyces buryatensis]|uniref:DUF4190 domain-containing protein n=1 Tax=Glycomyces buryatensis TaxID=2570927 RepID=A0A4S8QLQ7_9ACTN|nr:hypothetical protein [Glycomyces buryatensis]THV42339.1 hypothetical protein FAB82_06690 [Glycomyces buryatensis]